MANPENLVEIWRGDLLESIHAGHAVVCGPDGDIRESWGDPTAIIYPRSSCKMIQALPWAESGAAAGYSETHLAFACASHNGAAIHADLATRWLADLGLSDKDLRCGPQWPADLPERNTLIKSDSSPCQVHNNCSGKHCGFLAYSQYLGAGPEYVEVDHPVQVAAKIAFEEVTGETSPTFGIDGCSAPNHACSVHGLARAMAFYASAHTRTDARSTAASSLAQAMMAHPEYVAGETRACTELMRAMDHRVAIKTGAEGVFVAIIPEQQIGIALKIADGATRASEAALTALLVRYGVLDGNHPAARERMFGPITNRRDLVVGEIHTTPLSR